MESNEQTEVQEEPVVKKKRIKRIEEELDVYKNLHKHLLDPKYSKSHRFRAGTLVMVIGVSIVKASAMIDFWIIHFIADVVGYGIHGLGLIVFANLVEKGGDENGKK